MATYTFTTTAAHDAAIRIRVDAANAQITAQNTHNAATGAGGTVTPLLTHDSYLRNLFAGMFKSWIADDEDRLVRRAQTGETLTTAEKDKCRALLGL